MTPLQHSTLILFYFVFVCLLLLLLLLLFEVNTIPICLFQFAYKVLPSPPAYYMEYAFARFYRDNDER